MGLRHKGQYGYVDDEAEGAWSNGTRVVKARCLDVREATPVGTPGIVLGSMAMPPDAIDEQRARGLEDVKFGYFIEWDDKPDMPTFCIDKKLALAPADAVFSGEQQKLGEDFVLIHIGDICDDPT